jgi:Spy/CpxP family protein refolding chaperone
MKRSYKIILTSLMVVGISGTVFAFGARHHCTNANAEEKAEMFTYHISRKLDLNSEQEVHLEQLAQRAAQVMQEVREARGQRVEMVAEFLTDQPLDQSALLQKITDKTTRVNQLAPEMVGLLAQFVDSLDAGQKAELRELISKRRGFGGWRHRHGDRQPDDFIGQAGNS